MATDFLVLGAGMAGACAGYFLADHGKVVLLEKEETPGYHSTGRSAALYTEAYGNAAIRALTVASGAFFRAPPAGFADAPLLRPRGVLTAATADDEEAFAEAVALAQRFAPVRVLERREALALCPVLREDWVVRGMFEPGAMDMDVHAIHQGFLRGIRAKGGGIVTAAAPKRIERRGGLWQVATPAGAFAAPMLVNAAGAWADAVAEAAGVPPVGLVPKRRTAMIVAGPALPFADWPLVVDVASSFYFKPESGRLLLSPADETPVPPQDVQPEEIDVALAVARVMQATALEIDRIDRKWAGLRTFAPDETLVLGPDPAMPGFLWMAGQGGYGIQTAPAAGAALAALATEKALPAALTALGLAKEALLPDRLRSTPPASAPPTP
ncbi:MAG TPA: FAD-binding oxidoreductase [Stellaceae bacterium]|nr:FAD-binding oxidoreductase [Stellaceae bacterium]